MLFLPAGPPTSGPLAQEDFARCRDMGLNSFRMSIEWSRVQPTTHLGSKEGLAPGAEPPPFDTRALYSYAQRIAECQAHGLEPIITPAPLCLSRLAGPRCLAEAGDD